MSMLVDWNQLWSIFSTRTSPDFTFILGTKKNDQNPTRLQSYKAFLVARSPELAELVKNASIIGNGDNTSTFYLQDMDPLLFTHFHEV
jgi:hypothetical protein